MEGIEYEVEGITLVGVKEGGEQKNLMEVLNILNSKEYHFVIYDALDEVHNRKKLIMFDLEEIHNNSGLDNIYIMGHFNKEHKEMFKLSEEMVDSLVQDSTMV